MPCFDKKLESSRSQFYNEMYKTKDVDCVVSTMEIERLIESRLNEWNSIQISSEIQFDKP